MAAAKIHQSHQQMRGWLYKPTNHHGTSVALASPLCGLTAVEPSQSKEVAVTQASACGLTVHEQYQNRRNNITLSIPFVD